MGPVQAWPNTDANARTHREGNAVHFDSEAQRRPLAHELIKAETFETIYATDDGVGILGEVSETRLGVGLLN